MFVNKRAIMLVCFLGFAFIALSCAPGNARWDQDINPGHRAGFWAGIWHGLIVIITFIISLFNSKIGIYEASNTGWSYNLGFLIGLCFSILAPWRIKRFRTSYRKKE
jgi:hypothetical protein